MFKKVHSRSQAEDVVLRIKDILQEGFTIFDSHMEVEASIGTAIYSVDGDNIDTLLTVADSRMYGDKEAMKRKEEA